MYSQLCRGNNNCWNWYTIKKLHEIGYINGNIVLLLLQDRNKFLFFYYHYYVCITYEPHPPITLQNWICLHVCHFLPWFFKHLHRHPMTLDGKHWGLKQSHTHEEESKTCDHARALHYHIYIHTLPWLVYSDWHKGSLFSPLNSLHIEHGMIWLDKRGQQSQMPTRARQEKQMGKAGLETEKSAALSAAYPRGALLCHGQVWLCSSSRAR